MNADGGGTKAALDRAAGALHESARSHKRLEFQHRKHARELMRQLDYLRAQCAKFGIQLEIDTDPLKEGHSHG